MSALELPPSPLFAMSPAEFAGLPPTELCPPQAAQVINSHWRLVISGGPHGAATPEPDRADSGLLFDEDYECAGRVAAALEPGDVLAVEGVGYKGPIYAGGYLSLDDIENRRIVRDVDAFGYACYIAHGHGALPVYADISDQEVGHLARAGVAPNTKFEEEIRERKTIWTIGQLALRLPQPDTPATMQVLYGTVHLAALVALATECGLRYTSDQFDSTKYDRTFREAAERLGHTSLRAAADDIEVWFVHNELNRPAAMPLRAGRPVRRWWPLLGRDKK